MYSYFPAWHSSHAVLTPDAGLYFPASQSSHMVLTPAAALCFPAGHSSQTVLTPADDLYFPASQPLQAAAPAKVENLPAEQFEQGVDPVIGLYFPATHAVQACPSAPVSPALHLQLVKLMLPAGEFDVEGHSEHEVLPSTDLYVLAGQTVHTPPFAPEKPA